MTPIIRTNKPIESTRRRLLKGVLKENDNLLPPSAIFTGEEAQRQIEEAIEDPDQIPLEEDEIDPFEEEVKPSKTTRVRMVTTPVVDDAEEEPEVIKTKKITKARKIGVNPIEDIMTAMRNGEALMLKKEGINTYQVSVIPNDIIVSKTGFQYLKKGITGRQYWDEVLNPAFTEWSKKWNAMTYSEKLKYTKSKGIKWDAVADNPKLDVMRMTEAVRKAENIEKYKPEYRKRSARSKVRG
jgi:hypothetical protein